MSKHLNLLAASIALILLMVGPGGTTAAERPPGIRLDVGGHKLHIHCLGKGRPTVILDAGLGGSSKDWSRVQAELAQTTQTCVYDRAGYGWSDSGPLPRTSGRIAAELHTLLERAAILPPYILAGHSFGGYNMRLYASRYPQEMAGLVLVDTPNEGQMNSIFRGQIMREIDPQGLLQSLWPDLLTDVAVDLEPLAYLLGLQGKTLRAILGELASFEKSGAELRTAPSQPDLPLVVIMHGKKSPANTTVLILGETGTGKELIAAAIHNMSPRKDRPLITVNCAALPANLIESELFGREKGAFTGADARRVGRFEVAHGSTLCLDEIGELPLELQAKLLRVIQHGEFERLGSSQTIKVDVRIVATTNRDLEEEVRKGRFRQDLYYRLNVFPITVPPLRQRKEDIPLLAQSFIERYARKLGKQITSVQKKTMKTLQDYPWPGNVRELESIIERAVILCPGPVLHLTDKLEISSLPHVIRHKNLKRGGAKSNP